MNWGGMYEHLESGRQRLMIVVPARSCIIFLLLFTTFNSLKQAALVFTGIPFAISGGILALVAARHAVLDERRGRLHRAVRRRGAERGRDGDLHQPAARAGTVRRTRPCARAPSTRLRPVLMTALVAGLGFVPMALSHGTGAEVQRPLATVVIGGLITSTLLTLLLLPMLYAGLSASDRR